jgi:hypothetical protein
VAIFCIMNSIINCCCVIKSINGRCFIQKSVKALITNEHYCLRVSNIELKLNTIVLHFINY